MCERNCARIMYVRFHARCHQNLFTCVCAQGVQEAWLVQFEWESPTGAHRCVRLFNVIAHASRFSCVNVWRKRPAIQFGAVSCSNQRATLGRPFNLNAISLVLVLSGAKMLRRRVGEFFWKMLMVLLVFCVEHYNSRKNGFQWKSRAWWPWIEFSSVVNLENG